jgi:putative membrane protein
LKRKGSILVFIILVAISAVMVFPAKVGRTTGGKTSTKAPTAKIPATDREIEFKETVFAVLNPDGTTSSTTSSNWLRVGPGRGNSLYLPGSYHNVENLRGAIKPTVHPQGLWWPVESKKTTNINFSSKTNQSLPIQVKVTYRLNGKKVQPRQVVGKAGTLKITLSLHNLTRRGGTCVPMLLNLSTEFPYNEYSQIQADGATTVLVGKDLKASWLLFPNPHEQVTITLKGQSLKPKGFELSVIPALPPLAMIDIAPQLAQLLSGMEQIQGGLAQADRGAQELSTGSNRLAWGLASLQTGLQDLKRLFSAQLSVARSLDGQLSGEAGSAPQQLAALTNAHREVLSQTEESLCQVPVDKLSQTPKQLAQLLGGMEQLETASGNLAAGLAGHSQVLTAANDQNHELALALGELATNNPSLAKTADFAKIEMLLAKQAALLDAAQNGNEKLPGATTLTSGAEQLHTGLTQATAGVKEAAQEASLLEKLGGQLTQLKQALALVLRGGQVDGKQLPGLDQLARSLERLALGMEQLRGGVALLVHGGNVEGQYLPGLDATCQGLDASLNGAGQLADGANFVSSGSMKLAHGLEALQSQGTGKMIGELERGLASAKKANSTISAMEQRLHQYDSFSGKPQGANSQVRFLLKIKAPGEA